MDTAADMDTATEESGSELEIDEICQLFRNWGNKTVNEALLLELIRHFYPDTVIEDNKYILHMKSSMWDKHTEVVNALKAFRAQNDSVNLYDAYSFYCVLPCKNKMSLMVSKRYFEKIATTIIQEHMDGDGMILSSWWKSNV